MLRTSTLTLAVIGSLGLTALTTTGASANYGRGGMPSGHAFVGGHSFARITPGPGGNHNFAFIRRPGGPHLTHYVPRCRDHWCGPHHYPPHITWWWWHRWHHHVYASYDVIPDAAPAVEIDASRCSCLTKEYLPDGSVLFKDVCTKEEAMAPAPDKQAEDAPPAPPPQVR